MKNILKQHKMKTSMSLILLGVFALACKKENMQPALTSANVNSATAAADSVKFWDTFPITKEDYHDGKAVCILEAFTVERSNFAILKSFSFTIFKSPGATLTSAKLLIDGSVRIVPITGNKLVFTFKKFLIEPQEFGPPNYHGFAIRITGDGAPGEWYKVRLDSAVFLKHGIYNLPQQGDKMVYQ